MEPADYGENKNIHIIPMVYQTVLRKAHQRTFNLKTKLQEIQPAIISDPEVDEVLRVGVPEAVVRRCGSEAHIPSSNGKASSSAPTVQTEVAHDT